MSAPVFVDVLRGGLLESRHLCAFAVVGPSQRLLAQAGDVDTAIFPRSAVKIMQCLPLVELGGAEQFGLEDHELALLCASHNGEARHVEAARSILEKIGVSAQAYQCGTHWSLSSEVMREMAGRGESPEAVHHNCSGKHAGMLALARLLGVSTEGYTEPDHPVQKRILHTLMDLCGLTTPPFMGVDGCSVPTWAVPLRNLALGFHRLVSPSSEPTQRDRAALRLIEAVRAHPFMVAGRFRFCTRVMEKVPRVFVKVGAEGVFCAAIPHAHIGIAVKCQDGTGRAAEATLGAILGALDVWTDEERTYFQTLSSLPLKNARKRQVGEIRAVLPSPL